MPLYTVAVTRVSTYEVEAYDQLAAEDAVLFLPGRVDAETGIPQLISEETTSVLVDSGDVVLVRFHPGERFYAYELPTGVSRRDVKLGAEFLAPGFAGTEAVVQVVGFGRGDYEGPLKRLTGRVVRS